MRAKEQDGNNRPQITTGGGDFVAHDKVVYGDEVHGDKVVYTRSGLEELNDYLARAVAVYEARMYQALKKQPPPPIPTSICTPTTSKMLPSSSAVMLPHKRCIAYPQTVTLA